LATRLPTGGQRPSSAPAVTANVGIGQIPGGFGLDVELQISLPGLDRELVKSLIDAAHQVCPYSNATRGNIDVRLVLS